MGFLLTSLLTCNFWNNFDALLNPKTNPWLHSPHQEPVVFMNRKLAAIIVDNEEFARENLRMMVEDFCDSKHQCNSI